MADTGLHSPDAMPFEPPIAFPSPTGATLRLFRRGAEGPQRGVVQVNHGLAEHALRYERFADFMAARGFAIYAHDHRGHGGTTAPDAPRGSFARSGGAAKVVADTLAVSDLIAREHPGSPLILFGHSMGGLIALNALLREPERVAGAAIWNANFSAGGAGWVALAILAWERFRLGSDVPSRLLPRLTFHTWNEEIADRRTAFHWLSHDEEEVAKYVADPLCGWDASVSMWRDVFELISEGARDSNLRRIRRTMPFNLVGGGSDPSTGGGRAVEELARRLRGNGLSNVETTIYPQARHESLNELNRDAIMSDFARWAERVAAAALPAGGKPSNASGA